MHFNSLEDTLYSISFQFFQDLLQKEVKAKRFMLSNWLDLCTQIGFSKCSTLFLSNFYKHEAIIGWKSKIMSTFCLYSYLWFMQLTCWLVYGATLDSKIKICIHSWDNLGSIIKILTSMKIIAPKYTSLQYIGFWKLWQLWVMVITMEILGMNISLAWC